MALLNDSVYAGAQQARMLAAASTSSDSVFQITVDNAINTAIGSGLFTCTVSTSGIKSHTIQGNMNILKQMGYTATLSGTTLTISW